MRARNNELLSTQEIKRAGLTATAGVLAAVTLAACAPGETKAEPTPAPTSTTIEATPTTPPPSDTDPAVIFEKLDTMELSPLPPELKPFADMLPEDFAALTKKEQGPYATYLTQNREQFMAGFALASGDAQSKPFILTPDSPVLDKIEYNNYTYRIALSLTEGPSELKEDGTCGPIDQDSVKKLTIASNTDLATALADADKIINFANGQAVCPTSQALGNAFDSGSWNIIEEGQGSGTIDGQEVPRDEVRFTAADGKTYGVDLYTFEVPTYDNKTEYHTVANYLFNAANGSGRPQ